MKEFKFKPDKNFVLKPGTQSILNGSLFHSSLSPSIHLAMATGLVFLETKINTNHLEHFFGHDQAASVPCKEGILSFQQLYVILVLVHLGCFLSQTLQLTSDRCCAPRFQSFILLLNFCMMIFYQFCVILTLKRWNTFDEAVLTCK